jgi:hypothetical protein
VLHHGFIIEELLYIYINEEERFTHVYLERHGPAGTEILKALRISWSSPLQLRSDQQQLNGSFRKILTL